MRTPAHPRSLTVSVKAPSEAVMRKQEAVVREQSDAILVTRGGASQAPQLLRRELEHIAYQQVRLVAGVALESRG